MYRTISRSLASVLLAGAFAVACSATPSLARGGGGGGGGPAIPGGGGGGFHGGVGGGFHGGGGEFAFHGAPSRGFSSGGNFRTGPEAARPAQGNGGGGYAYDGGHRRNYGNGGYNGYYGGEGYDGYYDGSNLGYNAYCSPYWLSVNPSLCYNGS